MKIPEHMNNDQSKLIAGMLVLEREIKIAEAKLYGLRNRYKQEFGSI